jgi:glycosyltransferase involved in cell wall biosynthesis
MKVALLTTDNREHYHEYDKKKPYFGTAPEALLQGFALLPEDVEIHVVSCIRKPMPCPIRLAPNIFFHGIQVSHWGWLRTGYLGCIRGVQKKLREIQPDIVHGQGTERDCALSAAYSGFPNVVTIHGNMAEIARHKLIPNKPYAFISARLETLVLKRTWGVFCNSNYTESLVKPRAPRTWLVPNALREQFFSYTNELSANSPNCVLLNIGAVIQLKRQLEILALCRTLNTQGLHFETRFIGRADPQDPYASNFLARIREAENDGYARYLGTQSTGEIIDAMDRADGLIHFPLHEAFGLVVAEGLARGLKFFGANLGGIPDIASDVPGAELFETNDKLSTAIARWIKHGFPRQPAAAQVMKERYHPLTVAKRHLEIYREVLSR